LNFFVFFLSFLDIFISYAHIKTKFLCRNYLIIKAIDKNLTIWYNEICDIIQKMWVII